MSDIQSVIDKVRKLRALAARAGTVQEAEAAAAIADKLFQEHGLEEAQLEAAGTLPAEAPAEETEPLVKWIGKTPTWGLFLVDGLIEHYDCVYYRAWLYPTAGPSRWRSIGEQIRIVGRPSDVATVRYMWGWLSVEIERLAQLHKGNGRSWLDSFRRGAVRGVLEKLRDSKRASLDEARAKSAVVESILGDKAPGSTAIAIYDARGKDAKAKLYELHPDIEKRDKRSRGGTAWRGASSSDGYHVGRQAGGNIHTGAALGGGGSVKALKT